MSYIKAHKAVDFIRDNAKPFAVAKSQRILLEEMRKSKKALLMSESTESTAIAREQYAYSHPDYITLLHGIKEAVEVEETLKWQMTAAQMRCEVIRSEEASNRAIDRAAQ